MISVIYTSLAPLAKRQEAEIIASLSPQARERLSKKREQQLRLASLRALSLLSPEQRGCLAYTESGRPYFEGLRLCISITHSKTLAAVAIGDGDSVGVDAEELCTDSEKRGSLVRTLNRFFPELDAADLTTPELTWTKKEALFKYLGGVGGLLSVPHGTDQSLKYTSLDVCNCVLTVCTPENSQVEFHEIK